MSGMIYRMRHSIASVISGLKHLIAHVRSLSSHPPAAASMEGALWADAVRMVEEVLVLKLEPVYGGHGETREEAAWSRLVGGSLNKQGNVCMRFIFDSHKRSRALYLPTRIKKKKQFNVLLMF